MKSKEAYTLKVGDLVVINHKLDKLYGWVFEIEEITAQYRDGLSVTLKQPNFDAGFRKYDYPTKRLKKYEP